ncbi:MAG: hypothetical protein ACP5P4_15095 [Steroidobacteraceae bacterium]
MSGWIKFEKDLLTDPRVVRIARALGRRWVLFDSQNSCNAAALQTYEQCNARALPAVTLVCGALVRIWSLADTHIKTGDILPLGTDELDEIVGLPGFCEMLPAEWLVPLDGSVKLPGFHEHNGTAAKKKAVTQERVRRYRARNAGALQRVTPTALPDQDQDQDQSKSARAARNPPPDGLDPEAWERWLEYRKQIRKPLKPASIPAAQKSLAAFGSDQAAVVEQSIANGWQGLFAPKAANTTQRPKEAPSATSHLPLVRL